MAVPLTSLSKYQQQLKIAASRSSGAVIDATKIEEAVGGSLKLDSFSGTDLSAILVMPTPSASTMKQLNLDPDKYKYPTTRVFAELQTLSISSARSVAPVRRLGEAHVHEYLRGPRTIAGSMVFTTFSRDVFAEFYRLHGSDTFNQNVPMHVDQIPEFHILIQAANEYGTFGAMALVGVTLTNFGTTMSVHDLMLESSYTYVARMMYPFVRNTLDFKRIVSLYTRRGSEALSDAMANYDGQTYKFGHAFTIEEAGKDPNELVVLKMLDRQRRGR